MLLWLAALAAPWLAPGDPTSGDLTAALRSPSTTYPLGTDAQGRDVLSRVLFGARLSLAVGLASQVIALAAGLALGLTAGFYGRWVDAVVMRAADVTLKERRRLVLVVRETPLSEVHLENMLKLARMGVSIVPPMPAFYNHPQTVDDLVDHIIARVLDQFGIPASFAKRWDGHMQTAAKIATVPTAAKSGS